MKQLIVLGNGFDIACKLKSSYADFFLARFNDLFCDGQTKFDNLKEMTHVLNEKRDSIIWDISTTKKHINLLYDEDHNCDYFKANSSKWSNSTRFNRWDVIFLFAQLCIGKDIESYEWQDVESIIFEVVSIALNNDHSPKISYREEVDFGLRPLNGREAFEELVNYISYTGKNTHAEVAAELLSELKKFEAAFSDFIVNQIDWNQTTKGYINKAVKLYERISKYTKTKDCYQNDQINVLSFNYSLDEKFIEIIDNEIDDYRLKSWSNIHGIAHHNRNPYYPAPIFGIDNHDILSQNSCLDYRTLFTKPYRVIEGGINEVRDSGGYADTDLISIYGHSLGRADYSYFETLFDENKLYYSNCKIEYYYYPGENENSRLINRQEAITNLYNLLTDYGKTLSETHGSSIVSKLNLENRISVIPSE